MGDARIPISQASIFYGLFFFCPLSLTSLLGWWQVPALLFSPFLHLPFLPFSYRCNLIVEALFLYDKSACHYLQTEPSVLKLQAHCLDEVSILVKLFDEAHSEGQIWAGTWHLYSFTFQSRTFENKKLIVLYPWKNSCVKVKTPISLVCCFHSSLCQSLLSNKCSWTLGVDILKEKTSSLLISRSWFWESWVEEID